MTAPEPQEPDAPEPATSNRRTAAWIMLVAGAVILLAIAWVGWRTYQAYQSLQAASVQVGALQRQLSDPTQLEETRDQQRTIANLQANASTARSAVDDPVYRLASGIPFVGPNLDAIRQVSLTVDALSTDVIPSLDDISQRLKPSALAPKNGAIDLAPLVAVAPQLQQADATVRDARNDLSKIDQSAVVAPIGDAVSSLRARLDAAADLTEPAARAARLLPAALGAGGTRTYLVAFQNLAEPRATGGIFGSYAVLTADQGRVSMADQGPARSMGVFESSVGDLSDQQRQLFGSELVTYPADVNLTPDFPTAAKVFIDMYRARGGGAVDGVIAVDPVALSYLIKGSPALVVDGVEIDSEDVVSTLLSTAYERFDDADHDPRDQFLASVTSAAFGQITSGTVAPESLLAGLRKAAAERRLLYYSAHADEQKDIMATGLSGAIDGSAESAGIGVFLNDAMGSKLGYYLAVQSTVTGGQCQADGSQLVRVTVDLNYQPPASGVAAYVNGKSPDGSYRTHVQLVAPTGGRVNAAEVDGQPASLRVGTDLDRPFGIAVVDLSPGATAKVSFFLSVPPSQSTPALVHTPTVADWPVDVQGLGCSS